MVDDRFLAPLEGVEQEREELGINADAVVGDFDNEASLVRLRADDDPAALGGVLDGIRDEVPNDLLQSGGVGVDVLLGGREVQHQVVILGEEVAPADYYGVQDQDVDVGGLKVVGHLAACD